MNANTYENFRDFLNLLEKNGKLVRVRQEVRCNNCGRILPLRICLVRSIPISERSCHSRHVGWHRAGDRTN